MAKQLFLQGSIVVRISTHKINMVCIPKLFLTCADKIFCVGDNQEIQCHWQVKVFRCHILTETSGMRHRSSIYKDKCIIEFSAHSGSDLSPIFVFASFYSNCARQVVTRHMNIVPFMLSMHIKDVTHIAVHTERDEAL